MVKELKVKGEEATSMGEQSVLLQNRTRRTIYLRQKQVESNGTENASAERREFIFHEGPGPEY